MHDNSACIIAMIHLISYFRVVYLNRQHISQVVVALCWCAVQFDDCHTFLFQAFNRWRQHLGKCAACSHIRLGNHSLNKSLQWYTPNNHASATILCTYVLSVWTILNLTCSSYYQKTACIICLFLFIVTISLILISILSVTSHAPFSTARLDSLIDTLFCLAFYLF
jgi:hypothetical protein